MRTKEELLRAAIATDASLKHAQKLKVIFSHKAYASSYSGWAGLVEEQLALCRAYRLMALALSGILARHPDEEVKDISLILASMRAAKKALKESIRQHRDLLKVRLPRP